MSKNPKELLPACTDDLASYFLYGQDGFSALLIGEIEGVTPKNKLSLQEIVDQFKISLLNAIKKKYPDYNPNKQIGGGFNGGDAEMEVLIAEGYGKELEEVLNKKIN